MSLKDGGDNIEHIRDQKENLCEVAIDSLPDSIVNIRKPTANIWHEQ